MPYISASVIRKNFSATVKSDLNLNFKLMLHPTKATFAEAKSVCLSVGSQIATIESLNFFWDPIISSIVYKVSKFYHTTPWYDSKRLPQTDFINFREQKT